MTLDIANLPPLPCLWPDPAVGPWILARMERNVYGEAKETLCCAFLSADPKAEETAQAVRREVRPASGNLSPAEVQGIFTDLGLGSSAIPLKAAVQWAPAGTGRPVNCIQRRGIPASRSASPVIMPVARGEAAGGPAGSPPKAGGPAGSPPKALPPVPGYQHGVPVMMEIRALCRVDLEDPAKLVEEWLVRGEWKTPDPSLIPALQFMGVESRKVQSCGWRISVVDPAGCGVPMAHGRTTAAEGEDVREAAIKAAYAALGASSPAPLPASIPAAPAPGNGIEGKPGKPAEKPGKPGK